MRKRIRLLLVDDHPVVRKGIAFALKKHLGLEIVGEAGEGREAVRKALKLRPDVVLMDIEMPEMNGFSATELLRKELPEVRVLMLSAYHNEAFITRSIESGAWGHLSKESGVMDLVRAIEAVHSGVVAF